jgi:hypothetical protein
VGGGPFSENAYRDGKLRSGRLAKRRVVHRGLLSGSATMLELFHAEPSLRMPIRPCAILLLCVGSHFEG